MSLPIRPIFVVEGLDDVYVYATIEDAQLALEPWWVEQNLGVVYDAEGRLLKLAAGEKYVYISPGEVEPMHAAELEAILRSYLKAIGDPKGDDLSCDLKCLVEVCRKFIYTPSSPKNIIFNVFRKLTDMFRKVTV